MNRKQKLRSKSAQRQDKRNTGFVVVHSWGARLGQSFQMTRRHIYADRSRGVPLGRNHFPSWGCQFDILNLSLDIRCKFIWFGYCINSWVFPWLTTLKNNQFAWEAWRYIILSRSEPWSHTPTKVVCWDCPEQNGHLKLIPCRHFRSLLHRTPKARKPNVMIRYQCGMTKIFPFTGKLTNWPIDRCGFDTI